VPIRHCPKKRNAEPRQKPRHRHTATDPLVNPGNPPHRHQTLPLTGVGCVTRVYTSLAVLDIVDGHFVLREKHPAVSLDELRSLTGAEVKIKGPVNDLIVPEV
jgi:3-oxoadipate CoA-transferase beta subunit